MYQYKRSYSFTHSSSGPQSVVSEPAAAGSPGSLLEVQIFRTHLRYAAVAAKSLQSCPTLCDPMGLYSSWNSPGQNTEVGSLSLLQGMFPTHGSNPGLLHCWQILYQLSHKGSPISLIGSAKFYVNLINSKSKPKSGTGVDETPVYNPFTAASGGYSSPAVG